MCTCSENKALLSQSAVCLYTLTAVQYLQNNYEANSSICVDTALWFDLNGEFCRYCKVDHYITAYQGHKLAHPMHQQIEL